MSSGPTNVTQNVTQKITSVKGEVGPGHGPVAPLAPPATFDFSVSSLKVKNPRSLRTDTDYATLAVNVLTADKTVIKQYQPVARSLGDLGKGATIDPGMSVTGIAIPDGGSLAISFVVVNKGGWDWSDEVMNTLELAGSAVLGAVVQGTIVAPATTTTNTILQTLITGETTATTTATALSLGEAAAIAAGIIAVLEGVNILFPGHCDGTVVPGVLSLGKTELLQYAAPGAWNIIYDYPGTDSPDGCGANSDYTVTYSVEPTPPPVQFVAVPDIVGKTIENGLRALNAVGLIGIERIVHTDDKTPSIIFGQVPQAGSLVAVHSEVQYDIQSPNVTPA